MKVWIHKQACFVVLVSSKCEIRDFQSPTDILSKQYCKLGPRNCYLVTPQKQYLATKFFSLKQNSLLHCAELTHTSFLLNASLVYYHLKVTSRSFEFQFLHLVAYHFFCRIYSVKSKLHELRACKNWLKCRFKVRANFSNILNQISELLNCIIRLLFFFFLKFLRSPCMI